MGVSAALVIIRSPPRLGRIGKNFMASGTVAIKPQKRHDVNHGLTPGQQESNRFYYPFAAEPD